MRVEIVLNLLASAALATALQARQAPPLDRGNPNRAKSVQARDVTPLNRSNPNGGKTLQARQDIDFDLIDASPDPVVAVDDSSNYNPSAAIAAVVADIKEDPLPQVVQRRSAHERRAIRVDTAPGYTDNISLGNVAINAPLDCAGKDTYMGVKIFTSGPFDTTLCAAACTAQSDYNLKHPPATGKPKTCQFYQTYSSYKDGKYQGQYCAMYTAAWDIKYATNKGQSRGTSVYTIQDSYIATNSANDGVTACLKARTCANPAWGNAISCAATPVGFSFDSCWCNMGMDGVGYCTANESNTPSCKTDADCGPGGICMAESATSGICAPADHLAACNPGIFRDVTLPGFHDD